MIPTVRLHRAALRHNLTQLSDACHQRGFAWHPQFRTGMPDIAIREVVEAGIPGCVCPDVSLACRAAACGVRSVWLLQRPHVDDRLNDLCQLATLTSLTPVIDHFVQAEAVSEIAARTERKLSVLIELRTSSGFRGIRAGHDAADLAVAANRLAGLTVDGILAHHHAAKFAEFQTIDADLPEHDRRALRGTVRDFRARQLPCDIVASTFPENDGAAANGSVQTTVTDGDQIFGPMSSAWGVRDHQLQYALRAATRVVCRPSITEAVVELGLDHLGAITDLPIPLTDTGMVPIRISRTAMLLRLEGGARDLAIGDEVIFGVPPTSAVLRGSVAYD